MLTTVESILNKFNKLNYYKKATCIAFLIVLVLLLCILAINPTELLPVGNWSYIFILLPTFAGSVIAGCTYLARIFDGEHPGTYGSCIGVCVGLSIAITLMCCGATMPFLGSLSIVAVAVFALGYINNFSGLAHRLETILPRLDNKKTENERPSSEKWIIGIGIFVALAMGVVIVVGTGGFGLISVAGVTTFLATSSALPAWVLSAVTFMKFVSVSASFADYFAKAFNVIRDKMLPSSVPHDVQKELSKRTHEYRGSFVGIVGGMLLGALLLIMIAPPPTFIGVALGLMVIVVCGSVLGGLFSRVGRLRDGWESVGKPLDHNYNLVSGLRIGLVNVNKGLELTVITSNEAESPPLCPSPLSESPL